MWSYLDEENTSRAAEFITDWSRLSKYCGIPERVALQLAGDRLRQEWEPVHCGYGTVSVLDYGLDSAGDSPTAQLVQSRLSRLCLSIIAHFHTALTNIHLSIHSRPTCTH